MPSQNKDGFKKKAILLGAIHNNYTLMMNVFSVLSGPRCKNFLVQSINKHCVLFKYNISKSQESEMLIGNV